MDRREGPRTGRETEESLEAEETEGIGASVRLGALNATNSSYRCPPLSERLIGPALLTT